MAKKNRIPQQDDVFVPAPVPVEDSEQPVEEVPLTVESVLRGLEEYFDNQRRTQEILKDLPPEAHAELAALNETIWAGWPE